MRFVAGLMSAWIWVLAAAIAVAGNAAASSRDELRVKMVDACVYGEWKHPNRRDNAAKLCKCAAQKAMKSLSKSEVADAPYFGDGLTSSQKSALGSAKKSCN